MGRCRTAKEQYLNRVTGYMREHLRESLTLAQIAREAGLSESYLNAIFKERTQSAPMDYYINMKMERACDLLTGTDLRIYQVAQTLGYDNQYYFSRAFKKVLGMSPKAYKDRSSDGLLPDSSIWENMVFGTEERHSWDESKYCMPP